MADIYFYQGETEETETGEVGELTATASQDDGLTPVEKLEKYAESENIFNRQMVARTVLEDRAKFCRSFVRYLGRLDPGCSQHIALTSLELASRA